MNEETKAIEETAKATQKAIDFLNRVIGAPLEELGYVIQDWAKYYRFKNLIRIHDRIEAIYRQRKLEGKPVAIPPRIAIPLIDAASIEDDYDLQELWARLIANTTDPSKLEKIHPSYIEVIKQLTPDEAKIIDAFSKVQNYPKIYTKTVYTDAAYSAPIFFEKIYKDFKETCIKLGLTYPEKSVLYLDNLKRQRLVEVGYNFTQELKQSGGFESLVAGDISNYVAIAQTRKEYLTVTDFGDQFIKACIRS